MKNFRQQWLVLLFLFLCVRGFGQSGPPALPPDPLLQMYAYGAGFEGFFGYSPIAYTNVQSVPFWVGDALLVENTNAIPSYLQFPIVETNGYTNLDFSSGSVVLLFAPDWASADGIQLGTGPGEEAYLIGAGDWSTGSPQGFFGLSTDPHGTNLSLWGLSNGVTTVYAQAAISWASNTFHSIDCEFSPSNSSLYLDGQLATSGSGVSIIPATNSWTNGFFTGSDANGYEQARGAFVHTEIWNMPLGVFSHPTNGAPFRTTLWPGSLRKEAEVFKGWRSAAGR
jgi:hypothetical protein